MKNKKFALILVFTLLLISVGALAAKFRPSPAPPDYQFIDSKNIKNITDNAALEEFDLKSSFKEIKIDLAANKVLLDNKNDFTKTSFTDTEQVETKFDLSRLKIKTNYRQKNEIDLEKGRGVKQTVIVENPADEDLELTLNLKTQIDTDKVFWDGKEYEITEEPQIFQIYEKTASIPEFAEDIGYQENPEEIEKFSKLNHTYQTGGELSFMTINNQKAIYNWMDVADLDHKLSVFKEDNQAWINLAIDVSVPAHSQTIIDPNYDLSDASSYNVRYEGSTYSRLTLNGSLAIGDVNGDGSNDLVLGGAFAESGFASNGSVWVIFSTLIDDLGASTGNNKGLSTASNYNIRFDGGDYYDELGYAVAIGDVNGDGYGDLLMSTYETVGGYYGSVYVVFSTLIDDVGNTTGNVKHVATASNYNILYRDSCTWGSCRFEVGDVNGDSKDDLVIGSWLYGGGGSAFVMFSTLIDDVGSTTGNVKPVGTLANFNVRYDGETSGDELTGNGNLAIGDVNGDNKGDLVLGTVERNNRAGAAYVMFSTLIDDVGSTTGNVKPLGTTSNFNIRYDGGSSDDWFSNGKPTIGDVNGDGYGDLVIGAYRQDYGFTDFGSANVMFSTLIDDVGTSVGNIKNIETASSYNIRYDGVSIYSYLTWNNSITIGDINGDGNGDLVIGAPGADYGGNNTGSVWVMFSALIDDVGNSTGNNKSLTNASSYNIRYDGQAANDELPWGDLNYNNIHIGDVNGDQKNDLVIGTMQADNNGRSNSGSVWVMFSTLIDDVGNSTGNIKPLGTSSHYSNRYDGAVAYDSLTQDGAVAIGDVNGDTSEDLLLGAYQAGSNNGRAWLIFGPGVVVAPKACVIDDGDQPDQLTVKWQDTNYSETNYRVERNADGAGWSFLADKGADATSHTDNSTAADHTYQYRIRAEKNGTNSDWCTTAVVNLSIGNFRFEGVKMEGVKIN